MTIGDEAAPPGCRYCRGCLPAARGAIGGELVLPAALHCGSTAIALSVSTPVTLSTRNALFSAPRANFSSRRARNGGVAPTEIAR